MAPVDGASTSEMTKLMLGAMESRNTAEREKAQLHDKLLALQVCLFLRTDASP